MGVKRTKVATVNLLREMVIKFYTCHMSCMYIYIDSHSFISVQNSDVCTSYNEYHCNDEYELHTIPIMVTLHTQW